MIPYLSLDLETTGLNPETDQILEVGAVIETWDRPLSQLPTFRRVLRWNQVTGSPNALYLNRHLLPLVPAGISPSRLKVQLIAFCLEHGLIAKSTDSVLVAGKNFGSFDLQFLKRLPGTINFKHRYIDPAMLYWDGTTVPPSLGDCLQAAGYSHEVRHTAVEDALDVIRVIRKKYGYSNE